jgi:glucose-6-phosphate isomerase
MSSTLMEPFALRLDFDSGRLEPHTSHIERHASSMRGAYADGAALEELIEAGDPLVYEVLQRDVPEEVGQLVCCTTVIHPGAVRGEYFMTKGHYHAQRETGEVYLGLEGHGMLLLQADGETVELAMTRGTLAYVPPRWAHRTINTGDEPFVFLAVYPGQAGHDYGAIERYGFARRVLRTLEGPVVVPAEEVRGE